MKKVMVLAIMSLVFSVYACSQSNDSIHSKFVYCEIVGTGSAFSTKVKIEVDYGQEVSFFNQDRRLKDDAGKSMKFNSMVDALNYMGGAGWEFVQAYVVTGTSGFSGVQNVYHWLLKREIKK